MLLLATIGDADRRCFDIVELAIVSSRKEYTQFISAFDSTDAASREVKQ